MNNDTLEIFALWFVLNRWIFPKLGIRSWGSRPPSQVEKKKETNPEQFITIEELKKTGKKEIS